MLLLVWVRLRVEHIRLDNAEVCCHFHVGYTSSVTRELREGGAWPATANLHLK